MRTNLCISRCCPSSQARVTSVKSLSALRSPKALAMLALKSFHWRQSFSPTISVFSGISTEGGNTPKYSLNRWLTHKVHYWSIILRFSPALWLLHGPFFTGKKASINNFRIPFQFGIPAKMCFTAFLHFLICLNECQCEVSQLNKLQHWVRRVHLLVVSGHAMKKYIKSDNTKTSDNLGRNLSLSDMQYMAQNIHFDLRQTATGTH